MVLRPYRGFQGGSGSGVVMYVDNGSTLLAVSGKNGYFNGDSLWLVVTRV